MPRVKPLRWQTEGLFNTPAQAKRWTAPPEQIVAAKEDVHVWRSNLDEPVNTVRRLERTLSPDEWQRADRFHRANDRRRFVVARGFLRELLGIYLEVHAAAIQFATGPQGKPSVRAMPGVQPVHFNLSHSGSVALLAIALRPVGIDIEKVRHDPEHDAVARQFFSAIEFREYSSHPRSERPRVFAQFWTRKEAYLKATGEGLATPLNSFTVSIAPQQLVKSTVLLDYTIYGIEAEPGSEAALAVQGEGHRISLWIWKPGIATPRSRLDLDL